MKILREMPIGMVGTALALCTLSNIYNANGYSTVRYLSFIFGAIILIMFLIKIFTSFDKVKEEYQNNVTASLYALPAMLLMILSSLAVEYVVVLGNILWFIGIFAQICLIILFLTYHVFRKPSIDVIIPSWYVTYLGLLVSTAIGTEMNFPEIQKYIFIYGVLMYSITMIFIIYRLIKKPIPEPAKYTKTILLAPISLIIVSYINIYGKIGPLNENIIYLTYGVLILTFIYLIFQLKSFFATSFTPGYAALTFPMAIACVASLKTAGALTKLGLTTQANIVTQFLGIQILITSAIVIYVAFEFLKRSKTWTVKNN